MCVCLFETYFVICDNVLVLILLEEYFYSRLDFTGIITRGNEFTRLLIQPDPAT